MGIAIDDTILNKIDYLQGNAETISMMRSLPAKKTFNKEVMAFLSTFSKLLMKDSRSKSYSDVVSFAYWIRCASLNQLEKKYGFKDDHIHLGRGLVFHIAPSNVPVNFAYSLVSGLLTGNANIVRMPSKYFLQVEIIIDAMKAALEEHEGLKPYIALVRYGHDKEINDALSSIADTRIIWGGDRTIEEIRKSPLASRGIEITFADRYSLAVIDADAYMEIGDKKRVAGDFYNDTYFTDQNACTSPRIVIWTGKQKKDAKDIFWETLYSIVSKKYRYQDIQGVNKLTSAYLAASGPYGAKVLPHKDNLIIRVAVKKVDAYLMEYIDNGGFFFEYDCDDVRDLRELCNDKRCQTIGMIGDKEIFRPLIESGVKGVDRIVDIGHTMDFDMVWDGYDLVTNLTRVISSTFP